MYYVLNIETQTVESIHATISEARTNAVEMGPDYIVAEQRDKIERCSDCGNPRSKHETDPTTLEQTKCPVPREEKTTPPQEPNRSPRSDY